jgi:multicomponent Na+:H+ antiporter subunit D
LNLELALPILIPLTAGAVSIALWRSVRYQRMIAVLATALLLAASVWLLRSTMDQGFLVMEMGSWPAPFSIVFVSDLLSAIMIVLTGIIGLAIAIYSLASTPKGMRSLATIP